MAEPNRDLDAAVRALHQQDRERANTLLDFLVTEPVKTIARRVVIRIIEQAREDGAAHPELAREIALRRSLVQADTEDVA